MRMAGMYGKGEAAEAGPKDLAAAIEEVPEEVEPASERGEELDPEQAGLVEEMGLTPEQGVALRRFIETMI